MGGVANFVAGHKTRVRWIPGIHPHWSMDDDELRIPALPDNVDFETLRLTDGFVDHEALHSRFTLPYRNFKRFKGLTPLELREEVTPRRHHLTNLMDDARIELLGYEIAAGIRSNLEYMRNWILGDYAENPEAVLEQNDFALACERCIYNNLNMPFTVTVSKEVEVLEEKILPIFSEGVRGETTEDVYEQALVLDKMYEEWKEENDASGGFNGETTLDPQNIKTQTGQQPDPWENEVPKEKIPGIDPLRRLVPSSGSGEGDKNDSVNTARKKIEDVVGKTFGYVADSSNDKVGLAEVPKGAVVDYTKMREGLNGTILGAQQSFLNSLMVLTRTRTVKGLRRGRPEPSRFYRTRMGERSICTKKFEGVELDTVVTVLIDESGSQCNSIKGLQRLSLTLGETLDPIRSPSMPHGLPFEIVGTSTSVGRWPLTREDGVTFSRRVPIELYFYKTFLENFHTTKYRLMSMKARRNWIDGEVLRAIALRQLAHCRQKRRVIFVLSDGEPCGNCEDHTILCEHLKESVNSLRSLDFEVYCFSIRANSPELFYGEQYCYRIGQDEIDTMVLQTIADIVVTGRRGRQDLV